jgi:hypothetical protein
MPQPKSQGTGTRSQASYCKRRATRSGVRRKAARRPAMRNGTATAAVATAEIYPGAAGGRRPRPLRQGGLDIKGVEAEAMLKVRLENLYDILDRALTTIDRNPQILEALLKTVDTAVDDIGQTAQTALGPRGRCPVPSTRWARPGRRRWAPAERNSA